MHRWVTSRSIWQSSWTRTFQYLKSHNSQVDFREYLYSFYRKNIQNIRHQINDSLFGSAKQKVFYFWNVSICIFPYEFLSFSDQCALKIKNCVLDLIYYFLVYGLIILCSFFHWTRKNYVFFVDFLTANFLVSRCAY